MPNFSTSAIKLLSEKQALVAKSEQNLEELRTELSLELEEVVTERRAEHEAVVDRLKAKIARMDDQVLNDRVLVVKLTQVLKDATTKSKSLQQSLAVHKKVVKSLRSLRKYEQEKVRSSVAAFAC